MLNKFNRINRTKIFNKFISYIYNGHKRSVNVKKNILYSFFLKFISIIIGIIYVPLLIDCLSIEQYGVWLTLYSIISWFSFFDIGIGNGLRNKLTAALANDNIILARSFISTTYAIVTIIFLSILIIFHIINQFLNWSKILNTNSINNSELFILSSVVFTFFILGFIFKIIGTILLADQRPALNSLLNVIGNILSLIVIYYIKLFSKKVSLILIGSLISFIPTFILIIASYVLFRKKYKNIRPSYRYIKFNRANELINLGVKFFVIQITALIYFSTSNFILNQIVGSVAVTQFNIAYKYFYVPVMVYSIFMLPIWSAVTDAFERKDFFWLKSTLLKLNKLSIVFIAVILIIVAGRNISYRLWIGSRVEIPLLLNIGLALNAIIQIWLSPYSQFINGTGKIILSMRFTIISSIFYIPIAIIFTKSFFGIAGTIFATIIFNGASIFFQMIQTYKLVNNKATGVWEK